jgi:hypothetical protein
LDLRFVCAESNKAMKSIFSNILTFRWSIEMKSNLESAWDLISNTDRINRSFTINPIDFDNNESTDAFAEVNNWVNKLLNSSFGCGRKHPDAQVPALRCRVR